MKTSQSQSPLIIILLITTALTQEVKPNNQLSGANTTSFSDNQQQKIIISVILGIILAVVTIEFVMFCICYCCQQCKSLKCSSFQYQSLIRKYNNVAGETMSAEQFISKRNFIIENLRRSQIQDNYFYFLNGKKYVAHINKVLIVKEEKKLLTTIKLEGRDNFGTWSARGAITCKNNRMLIWYHKEYDHKNKQWPKNLIYVSNQVQDYTGLEGIWFYKGFQNKFNDKYGTWRLDFEEIFVIEEQTYQFSDRNLITIQKQSDELLE